MAAEDRYDVLLQGNPFCDLTFTFRQPQELPALGQEVFAENFAINPGGVYNIASALAGMGLRVGLVAQLGTDIFSRFIGERMEECGLPTALIERVERSMPVVTVGISFPHDRLFLSYAERDDPAHPPPEITLQLLERHRPRALFSYGEHDPELYREARRHGTLVYMDAHWSVERLHHPHLRQTIPEASVFSPNLPEALEMTGADDAEGALAVLQDWSECIVIKTGSRGCLAACQGARYEVPAIPVNTIDTTGAGDNFNAGMIYGLLQGYPFETCLRCANIAGGLSTTVVGGCGSGVTAIDIEAWLRRLDA